ncbi:MAG: hypothetical protein GF329_02725 [Candidatus Lokiarchaeota archaeon]|nr:hypothetical protein [Candidatus Lokiarchaeota archaeon]
MTDRKDPEEEAAYKKFADKLKVKELKGEGGRIKELRKMVREFEEEFGKDINLMPAEMQIKYQKLRKEAGLPKISKVEVSGVEKPGLIDKSEYITKLANTILKLGVERKNTTGGILTISELVYLLKTETPFKVVRIKAVAKVLKKLEKEGLIAGIKKLDSGVKLVEFVPISFSKDQSKIIALASRNGELSLEEVLKRLNWSQERILRVLEVLEKSNIAQKDPRYSAGQKWYFPGLIKSK